MPAFLAGLMNSVAGGGTLVTFPILIAFGMNPKIANATSTVALLPGSAGGMWGYRREMDDTQSLLIRLAIPSIIGGAAGAGLLMITPVNTFANLVPYLILFATAIFIAQEPISRHLRKRRIDADPTGNPNAVVPSRAWWIGAMTFQFWVAVYGGYFGAGIGILMLASLGLLGVSDIHRANGAKTFLAICINGIAVLSFIVFRMVNWPEALLMSIGAVLGGYGSADIARRLGQSLIKKVVVAIGLLMGAVMLWKQWNG